MKEKSNLDIIYDTFVKYCYKIPYIRYIMLPIIFSTVLACYMEVTSNELSKQVVSDLKNTSSTLKSILKYIFCLVCAITLKQINEIIFSAPIQYIFKIVSVEAFYKYISLDLDSFNKVGNGEIQTIIERRSRAYGNILELTTLNTAPNLLMLILTFNSVYRSLGVKASCVMMFTALVYLILTIGFSIWRTKVRREYNASLGKSSNRLQDFLSNYEVIKSYNTETEAMSLYNQSQKPVEYAATLSNRILSGMLFLQKTIFAVQAIIIIILGVHNQLPYEFSAGQLIYYLTTTRTLTNSLNDMGSLYTKYVQGFLDAKSGYYEFKEEDQSMLLREADFRKEIAFKNVIFQYNEKLILDQANFSIKRGERVAIIGKNGTGKSTIIKLLMKFYKYEGDITIDDINIRNISDRVYRSLIAYATQNTFLFNETIIYNIKYGTKDISNKNIIELSKKMNVYDAILELNDAYATSVGERGNLLSCAERQKILLMRSLFKDSKILLMDEPTSALDKTSEKQVLEMILNENTDKTILMIVHNLDLLKHFDKILLVKDKKVETITDHKTRYEENSFYYKNILNL